MVAAVLLPLLPLAVWVGALWQWWLSCPYITQEQKTGLAAERLQLYVPKYVHEKQQQWFYKEDRHPSQKLPQCVLHMYEDAVASIVFVPVLGLHFWEMEEW